MPATTTPAGSGKAAKPRNYFATTHWTVVLSAGGSDTAPARDALARLCQIYWYPLYAFIRQRGYQPHDAQDLTQAFFERLLEKNTLGQVTREKGKFRSFLLTLLNHFIVDEWKRARAEKRGGLRIISLDAQTAETRFRYEPVETATPETIFERNWALALLETVFQRLQEEYELAGKGELFQHLKFCLTADRSAIPYDQLCARLGVTEGNLKVIAHRLRQRYRELLRAEVANTVSDPREIEPELRHLFHALVR
jgi:RNA polymerase sigma-70 factor (ECF subfamily)